MGMATSIVDSYPVKMQASDIFFICLAIIAITLAVSIRPALNAGRMDVKENLYYECFYRATFSTRLLAVCSRVPRAPIYGTRSAARAAWATDASAPDGFL
uniref:Uncharacterized protein n=1 Tax=Tanacetum cinerariifolium TaxID=118510 RepID=A0A699VEG8_TANCI|nr:hypothetical protein [Tanacetum cinerariifolium]